MWAYLDVPGPGILLPREARPFQVTGEATGRLGVPTDYEIEVVNTGDDGWMYAEWTVTDPNGVFVGESESTIHLARQVETHTVTVTNPSCETQPGKYTLTVTVRNDDLEVEDSRGGRTEAGAPGSRDLLTLAPGYRLRATARKQAW